MKRMAVSAALLLLVFIAIPAQGNIDSVDKWAWSTSGGWVNFAPDDGGITIYNDHLEGYAWGENVGWIRLGTYEGGDDYTYANTTAADYGVNNDGVGNLSGYAWGTNIGWINFAPDDGGVWIDPVTGSFYGYAWGENIGWIRFQNDNPAYQVTTSWRGGLTAVYQNDIAAIITDYYPDPAGSGGLTIADNGFLQDLGDGIVFGHNNAAFDNVAGNLPDGVAKRWARIWELVVVDDPTTGGGEVTLTFDISEAGGEGDFSDDGVYFLLKRDSGSNDDFSTVTVVDSYVDGQQLTFTVIVSELGSEFTLGADAGTPTAVSLYHLQTQSSSGTGIITVMLLALSLLLLTLVTVGRRRTA